MKTVRFEFLRIALAMCAILGGSADAVGQSVAISSGDWSDPATWSPNEPNATDTATVDGGFAVTISQAGEQANQLDVGNAATESGSVIVQPGGALSIENNGTLPSIRIGQALGGNGSLTVNGGSVTINGPNMDTGFAIGDLMIGDVGNGTMTMTDGTVSVSDEMVIAAQNTSTSTATITGGTLNVQRRSILVGFAGNGTLNVGGTANVSANFDLLIAFVPGSTGTFNQSGGTMSANFVFTNSFTAAPGSTAIVNMTGGTFNAGIAYVLGRDRGTTTMTHSGGTINALTNNGDMVAGDGPGNTSVYNISGTAEVNLLHNFIVGAAEGAHGTVNQTGGEINAGDHLFIGRDGIGVWNLDGGVVNARRVFLGDFDTSHGTMTVTGGTLNVSGDMSVGGQLADNGGEALDADGTLVVRGPGGSINVGGNFLANDGDHTRRRPDMTGDNVSTLIFEALAGGLSQINVTGNADLTGADIDVDLLSAFPVGTTFNLITAASISTDYLQAPEDVGLISLTVIPGGNGQILQATVVPEPATFGLTAAAALCIATLRRRRLLRLA